MLIFAKVRDSARRLNNALLMFYLAVSVWVTAGIGGVYYSIYKAPLVKAVSKQFLMRGSSFPYDFILIGMAILGVVYVIRRPEWTRPLIEWTGAWKSKDIDKTRELLILHGIAKPEDREWVATMLKEKPKKGEKNVNSNKVEIPKEIKPK